LKVAGRLGGPDGSLRSASAGSRLDQASVLPAVLAALAESAVIYLPIRDVAENQARVVAGPMAHYWLFVLVFTCAVGLATRLRGRTTFPAFVGASAIGIGAIQGIWWSTGDTVNAAASVVLWLLVAARVFTLALRDWRDPISTSFGVGTGLLLAEIILIGGFAETRAVLPFAVPQFFLASLASRAASLRLSTRRVTVSRQDTSVEGGSPHLPRVRVGVGLVVVAAFALLMALAAALGGRHGGLRWLGTLILSVLLPILAYVLAPIARLLLVWVVWLFGLLNIDLSPLRSAAGTIDDFTNRPPDATSAGGGAVGRILALLLLLALGYLLVRTIRSQWRRFEPQGGSLEEPIEPEPLSIFTPRRRRRRARSQPELPADTVRRWYAEALLALDGLGLPKTPSRTPGEFLREVTSAFPECAAGFTALTRAYEDVRYGSRKFDADSLGRLEANRQLAMTALGRADRLEKATRGEANDRAQA
jgi:Domain of unknown function (DUF4129)